MHSPVRVLEHQASYFACIGPGGNGNILQAPAQVTLRIGHRGAEKRCEADAGCGARLHEVSLFPWRRFAAGRHPVGQWGDILKALKPRNEECIPRRDDGICASK